MKYKVDTEKTFLDKFLVENTSDMTRSQLILSIRNSKVLVNNVITTKRNQVLLSNDIVEIIENDIEQFRVLCWFYQAICLNIPITHFVQSRNRNY